MEVTSVFTPRNSEVNLDMYVPRRELEEELYRSVKGTMHSLLFGDSGNGKSWLYKKVLKEKGIPFRIANCANASRFDSLTKEIFSTIVPGGKAKKVSYTEQKEAGLSAGIASAKLDHTGHYELTETDPLIEALSTFSKENSGALSVLVLDNLESIFKSDKLMHELADIIILLDDSRFSQFKIKLLIVGVPNGTLEYFAKTKNLESVANRLEELPKVGGMTTPQVTTLVEKGFELLRLGVTKSEFPKIARHIHHITMGVAQRVHEYCEKLAYIVSDQKLGYDPSQLEDADEKWLRIGLRQAYTVIEQHLNSKKTTIARRNQVIFAIGKITSHQFDASSIAEKVRELFPETSKESGMGISSILGELASGDAPLISKNPNTNAYRIVDPRYTMCIRVALYQNKESKLVEKRLFKS